MICAALNAVTRASVHSTICRKGGAFPQARVHVGIEGVDPRAVCVCGRAVRLALGTTDFVDA